MTKLAATTKQFVGEFTLIGAKEREAFITTENAEITASFKYWVALVLFTPDALVDLSKFMQIKKELPSIAWHDELDEGDIFIEYKIDGPIRNRSGLINKIASEISGVAHSIM
jgi:hypothetical protein